MCRRASRISKWRPAAQRLAELDNAINARADYFEQREQGRTSPVFTASSTRCFNNATLKGWRRLPSVC